MAVVAYVLLGPDNDSYMYRTWQEAPRCAICNAVLDHSALNPDFELKRDVYDASFTYDGACIVSELAKRIIGALEGTNLVRLRKHAGFYLLNVTSTVEFDAERRKTRFEKFCQGCQRFRAVAGATPAYVRGHSSALPSGIYRTDVEFGSDDERHPLLMVSSDVRDQLLREAYKGVRLEPVEGEDRAADSVSGEKQR